jgi:predicted nucleic acid-binding protein
MAWMLDTNAWIHYLKNPASGIRAGLERRTPGEVVSCAVVKAELLHGAMRA